MTVVKVNIFVLLEILQEALIAGPKQPTDIRTVWMAGLEYMRRRFDAPDIAKDEEKKRLEDLRATFSRAIEHINTGELSFKKIV